MITRKKIPKKLLLTALLVFIFMNLVAYFHAAKFTHFDHSNTSKTKDAKHLSIWQKINTLILGVNNPRPENKLLPNRPYETINLTSNKEIECWLIKADSPKGTVILFHGYSGQKSSLLDKADVFLELGYSVLLVDFMGSGGSEGNQTTLGFYEAEEVNTSFEYLKNSGEKNIILFGTSMGAVAIMKALNDYNLSINSIILECPFGSMIETVNARFRSMEIPAFPMAGLLVFWGSVQNKFNAFNLKPTEYAKNISTPTLLLYGMQDDKVSKNEIDEIFSNLSGLKTLKTYPNARHENYLNKYKNEWTIDIRNFIESNMIKN